MLLVIGQIIRPHGVRGEVVVDVRTDDPGDRFDAGAVLATDPAQAGPLRIEHARPHVSGGRNRLIIAFAGFGDRTAADTLRGVALQVESEDLPPLQDPDEYHDHQLVGLLAVGVDGAEFGRVRRIVHAPASELLVLDRPDGREALVPFVKAIVAEVDLAAGRVVVTPPDGLFDL